MPVRGSYSSLDSEHDPASSSIEAENTDKRPQPEVEDAHEDKGPQEPEDVYHESYWLYALLGAGILFPWNACITATDYFGALYPHAHIDRVFPVAYFCPNVATLLAINFRGGLAVDSRTRICGGYLAFLVALVVITSIGCFKGAGSTTALVFTVAAVGLIGAADGVAQGSLFAEAGKLPQRYTQALMGGTASSGVAISLLRVVTKGSLAATPNGLFVSSVIYFAVSAALVASCLWAYGRAQSLPIVRFYHGGVGRPTEEEARLSDAAGSGGGHELDLSSSTAWAALRSLHGHMGHEAATVFCVYVVSLAIFPGFLAEDVHSASLGDWYPVALILAFNVADCAGKCAPAVFPGLAAIPPRAVLLLSLARALFIPAFVLCTAGPAVLRTEGPIVLLTSLLGFTSGLYATLAMMSAPRGLPKKDAERAAALMVLYLVGGLFVGAVCGWLWLA